MDNSTSLIMRELFNRLDNESKMALVNNKTSDHSSFDSQSGAYLGKSWITMNARMSKTKFPLGQKSLELTGHAFNVMNLEEFLEENNLKVDSWH